MNVWNCRVIHGSLEFPYQTVHFPTDVYLLKTLIKIYIEIRWLLNVSVYDHHQGACN